ncbi:hypothetical protein FGO68_gene9581 [Halteria grandinella]|uniref:Uncharacterized protein n=1 Tax=Halteria grandinella TaxID=5974 RepID=A0A8J8NH65_HALGN|nr:hypothetical protein FGO68_gene9581 [Halteria grandinella]
MEKSNAGTQRQQIHSCDHQEFKSQKHQILECKNEITIKNRQFLPQFHKNLNENIFQTHAGTRYCQYQLIKVRDYQKKKYMAQGRIFYMLKFAFNQLNKYKKQLSLFIQQKNQAKNKP